MTTPEDDFAFLTAAPTAAPADETPVWSPEASFEPESHPVLALNAPPPFAVGGFDLDAAFLASVLGEGADGMRGLIEMGFPAESVQGPTRAVFDFALTYYQKYKQVPSADVLAARFGIVFPPPAAASGFFADELRKRRLQAEISAGLAPVLKALESHDPDGAASELERARQVARKHSGVSRLREIRELIPKAHEHYDLIASGVRGIASPWPTFDNATLGWWPGDFVLFVARQGCGKTFLTVVLAVHAWLSGKSVLYATTEMSALSIARRLIAVYLKLPYGAFRRAQLDEPMHAKFKHLPQDQALQELPGFWIGGGDFKLTDLELRGFIERSRPDIAFADGAYLIDAGGKERVDKMKAVFDLLKLLPGEYGIPLVATTQFNRQGAKETAVEHISGSDAGGWNADVVAALSRDDDQKRDNRICITPMKIREAALPDPIIAHWDFERMDFNEVAQNNPGYIPGVDDVQLPALDPSAAQAHDVPTPF